jgi:hypothetical protein
MAGGVVSKLGPTIPQCRFVGDGRNRFKIAANNLGPVGNGGPGSRRYPFPALTYRQNRGNEHGDEILRTWPSSEACGGRLVPSSQRPHASEATWLSRLPCVDTRQQGRFGRVQLRLRRMPECRSEPPLSCEGGVHDQPPTPCPRSISPLRPGRTRTLPRPATPFPRQHPNRDAAIARTSFGSCGPAGCAQASISSSRP